MLEKFGFVKCAGMSANDREGDFVLTPAPAKLKLTLPSAIASIAGPVLSLGKMRLYIVQGIAIRNQE
jgi:hypothetical protein